MHTEPIRAARQDRIGNPFGIRMTEPCSTPAVPSRQTAAAPTWARWSILGCSLLLFGYSTLRAITVSFSWDESWTYIHHVLPGIYFQQVHDQMGGNHHLLNVWGMIFFHRLLGDSELVLRLPNLLAHVIFLYATARLAMCAPRGPTAIATFLLLNLHPYLLDFFSLARGYGSACGWMMLSLWLAFRFYAGGGRTKHLAWATMAALLAAISHVIMLTYLLAFASVLTGIGLADHFVRGRKMSLWELVLPCAGAVSGLALVLPNALALARGGSLNFGCDSWWDCMMGTLGMKFLYHQPYPAPVLHVMALVLAAWAGGCLLTLSAAWRGGWLPRLRPMAFGVAVLFACLAGFFIEQTFLGVPLPQSRTALFLVPLAMFPLAAGLVAWPARSSVPIVFSSMLCLPLLAHQWNSLNLAYAVEWKPSGEVRRMIDIIQQDHLPLTAQRPLVTVASSDESWGAIPYYSHVRKLPWLSTSHRFPPDEYVPSDYYIVEYNGYDKVDEANWRRLYFSEATRTSLYRDERLRSATEVLFHASNDLERPGMSGADKTLHATGWQSIRLDSATGGTDTMRWVVPEGVQAFPLLICGTAEVLQRDDSNWVALVIDVVRDGHVISQQMDGSSAQVRPGAWCRAAVEMRVNAPLHTNDEVRFWIGPLRADPPIHVDDLQLWITH